MADARDRDENPAKNSDKQNDDGPSKKGAECDEKLDFYSEKFDPLLALKCKSLRPPVPNSKVFDNLAMFDSYLRKARKDVANVQAFPKPGTSKEKQVVSFERRFEPHQMPVRCPKVWKQSETIFTLMESSVGQQGILGALGKARTQNLRITVTIRHSHGIRGVCIANLTMFDKYWNMTLSNVEEYWIRRKKHKTPAALGASIPENRNFASFFTRVRTIDPKEVTQASKCHTTSKAVDYEIQKLAKMLQSNAYGRNNKNSELCHRRVNELLVRGEQVVFIAIAQGRQS